jgi:hypothetical protein
MPAGVTWSKRTSIRAEIGSGVWDWVKATSGKFKYRADLLPGDVELLDDVLDGGSRFEVFEHGGHGHPCVSIAVIDSHPGESPSRIWRRVVQLTAGSVPLMHTATRLVAALAVAAVLSKPSTAWAQTGPDLVIAMSHTGNFTVGVNGVYTIVVSNIGGTASSPPIFVDDHLTSLPFTFVSATGNGWSCVFVEHGPPVGATVECESSRIIAPGASAFPITLTVLPTASGTVTNTVELSPSLATGSDVTIVLAAVPTLPQWALIALTVYLALAGVLAMRRRMA